MWKNDNSFCRDKDVIVSIYKFESKSGGKDMIDR